MVTSFILSQVGENQNEVIYSSNPIDLYDLSGYLYSVSGSLTEKPSFFRCFRMRRDTVLAYFWKTNHTEAKSGRGGLFVIIGFIFDSTLLRSHDLIIDFGSYFFTILQQIFNISFTAPVSDVFFLQLQRPVEKKLHELEEKMKATDFSSPKCLFRVPAVVRRKKFPQALYCLDRPAFFVHWRIFSHEALTYLRHGYWDISSISGTTPASFQILNNGDPFPAAISDTLFRQYRQHSYIAVY